MFKIFIYIDLQEKGGAPGESAHVAEINLC